MWNATYTPGPWRVRELHPGSGDAHFFVEGLRPEGQAYAVEILGDEDYPTKRADAQLISAAPELLAICLKIALTDGLNTELRRELALAITKACGV